MDEERCCFSWLSNKKDDEVFSFPKIYNYHELREKEEDIRNDLYNFSLCPNNDPIKDST